ncbi:MAG: heavy metal-associated domain-containing protein [Saprospiraceae bacterium]
MKTYTIVDNIKCNGCAGRIKTKLSQLDHITNIEINIEEGKVLFECIDDVSKLQVITLLKSMGYPQKGQGSKIDNAKSYVSCMIGRIEN